MDIHNHPHRYMGAKLIMKDVLLGLLSLCAIITGMNDNAVLASISAHESFIELFRAPQIPDTVYSDTVTSNVLLDGQAFQGANISYALIDTINSTELLIREATTNESGQDIVDSLPVLKHFVGIKAIDKKAYKGLVITSNGTGSDHLIRFTSDAEVNQEGYIYNVLGQRITSIPIQYNPATKTYDAAWRGQEKKDGIYLFQARTTDGDVASKIKHLKDSPGDIDYGATPKEGTEKSTPELKEDGLAASPYKINITHEGLEDFIDTVMVNEGQYEDFFFNVNAVQYADGNIQGLVRFQENGQAVGFAHVEYKRFLDQTTTFDTTANQNGGYMLTVPVFYEPQNPGETKYLVVLTPTSIPFVEKTDTVLVVPGTNGFIHYVNQIPQNQTQDIVGIVRNVYSKNPESGVTVRVINRTTGDLIEEDLTQSDGAYEFDNIPAGTLVKFELGKPGELWMVNNFYDVPQEILDTLVTFNRYFYPATVEVPQVGANTTIQGDGEEIAEMVGPRLHQL